MKTYMVEAVRFDNDGTIAEGNLWNNYMHHDKRGAIKKAREGYAQLCPNDKKLRGFLVNEYEDDEYIGCVFEANRFTEMPENVPSKEV